MLERGLRVRDTERKEELLDLTGNELLLLSVMTQTSSPNREKRSLMKTITQDVVILLLRALLATLSVSRMRK